MNKRYIIKRFLVGILITSFMIFIFSSGLSLAANGDEYSCCITLGINGVIPGDLVSTTRNLQNSAETCPISKDSWPTTPFPSGTMPLPLPLYSAEKTVSHDWDGTTAIWKSLDVASCVKPLECLKPESYDLLGGASKYCLINNKVYSIDDGFPANENYNRITTCDSTWCGDWTIQDLFENNRVLSNEQFLVYHYYNTVNGERHQILNTWVYVNESQPALAYGIAVYHDATVNIYNYSRKDMKLEKISSDTFEDESFSKNIPPLSRGWYLIRIDYTGWNANNILLMEFHPQGNPSNHNLNEYFKIINSYGPLSQDGDDNIDVCENDPYGRLGDWTASTDPSFPHDKRCCGDDEDDLTYVDPNGNQCTSEGWNDEIAEECINPATPGETLEGTAFEQTLVSNTLANNGADGCCGDDSCAFNPVFCTSKTTAAECTDPCIWNTYITGQSKCEPKLLAPMLCNDMTTLQPLSYTECISKPYCKAGADYGYVATKDGSEYLCRNKLGDILTSKDEWEWISSTDTDSDFDITALYFSGKRVDYVSNSKRWYYCSADPVNGLMGNPVAEYRTFKNENYLTADEVSCSMFMNILNPPVPYVDCSEESVGPCCTIEHVVSISNPSSAMDCQCYTGESEDEINLCSLSQLSYLCGDSPGGLSINDLKDKSLCGFDMQACLNTSRIDPASTSCEAIGGEECSAGEHCAYGGFLITLNNNDVCCVGDNTPSNCVAETVCNAEHGGRVYTHSTHSCPSYYDNFKLNEQESCCYGVPVDRVTTLGTILGGQSNKSFICYSSTDGNIFGNCCYGAECANLNLLGAGNIHEIYYSNKSVFSTGMALQTISSFDRYIASESFIYDFAAYFKRTSDTILNMQYPTNMSGYSYLDFQVSYNNEFIVGNLSINNINYGPLKNYLVDGTKSMRWHHAVVPINITQKNDILKTLRVKNIGSTNLEILFDNIMLVPSQDSGYSENYYCTGGFTSWIPDLDTDLSQSDRLLGSNFYTTWESYGPYAFACNAQGSFQWTGQQCCGDDSGFGGAEYYSDLNSGCFEGTVVFEKNTVSYAKNYDENYPEEFNSFIYKDLIYNDSKFVSCQAPVIKYDDLTISYDGTNGTYPQTNQGTKLINTNINQECMIIGDYYCSNQAWRHIVPGVDTWNGTINLSTKSIPPNANLLKNSRFGGECTVPGCSQTVPPIYNGGGDDQQ